MISVRATTIATPTTNKMDIKTAITMPTLVVCGDEDRDNGSPDKLAAALPDAIHAVIPGTHMGCVTKPELGRTIRDWLAG